MKALPKPLRTSYRAKVYVTVTLVLILTSAFGVYIYVDVGEQLREDVESDLKASSELQSRLVAESLDGTVRRLDSISNSRGVRLAAERNDFSRLTSSITGLSRGSDTVSDVYYVNVSEGNVLVRQGGGGLSRGSSLMPSVHDRVVGLISADRTVSEPFRVTDGGKPTVVAVSGATNVDDRAVVAAIDIPSLSDSTLHSTQGRENYVLNSSGVVVAGGAGGVSRTPLSDAVSGSGPGFGTYTQDGDRMLAGYSSVDGYGWTVATTVPAQQAYSLRSRILRRILATVAVIVVGMGAVVLVNRNAVAALTRLSRKAREVRNGNLTTPIETERDDEIGELYESFDLMRYSLIENDGSRKGRGAEGSQDD